MEIFVGQIILAGFNFSPVDWAPCDGRLLQISQFEALFQLIGTTYGGDGQSTFALPDLRGRTALCMGQAPGLSSYVIGQIGGVEGVNITAQTYPNHTHTLNTTSTAGGSQNPTNAVLASGQNVYRSGEAPVEIMSARMCGTSGNSIPHDNRQPYLVCNWIISLFGIFPTQG